jgi:hypothetical protein
MNNLSISVAPIDSVSIIPSVWLYLFLSVR